MLVAILAVLAWVAIAGHLPYLWREWITSVDHKRIGVMYTLLAAVMLLRGFADAIRAEHGDDLSGFDLKIDAAQHVGVAVAGAKVANIEERLTEHARS